ncbi:hypothetical protein GOBAR_DD01302 [Gossypium barbadense]|nr:hypothetical protein GOBAR_DD01302 [Gossypium barbadense]
MLPLIRSARVSSTLFFAPPLFKNPPAASIAILVSDRDGGRSRTRQGNVRPVNVEADVRDMCGAAVRMCGGYEQMLLGFLKF